jgi:hypothetical protein
MTGRKHRPERAGWDVQLERAEGDWSGLIRNLVVQDGAGRAHRRERGRGGGPSLHGGGIPSILACSPEMSEDYTLLRSLHVVGLAAPCIGLHV